jgi:hypothetical protein
MSERYKAAIEICRTYATLGKLDMFPIGKVMTVFLAGVALGGKRHSPVEAAWLLDWMVQALQNLFPLNPAAVVRLPWSRG